MKKQFYLSSILLATLLLSGCSLTQQNSSSDSSASISVNPTSDSNSNAETGVKNIDLVTGDDPITIDGTDVTVLSGDEESIHLVQEADHAVVYPLKGGVVTLKSNADTWVLNIKYDIFNFSNGSDYVNATSEEFRQQFRGDKQAPFTVGSANNVALDLVFGYNTWVLDGEELVQDVVDAPLLETIKSNDIGLVNYTFSSSSVELNDSNINDYVSVNDDATLSFKSPAVGHTFQINIKVNDTEVNQVVYVNDGYNAYDSLSFKNLFEDNSVGSINVLRNFEAVLQENQYYYNHMLEKMVPYNTVRDDSARTWQGSLYYRRYTKTTFTPLTVNGNYMLIDGNNLPKHVPFNSVDKNGNAVEYSELDGKNDYGNQQAFNKTQAGAISATGDVTAETYNDFAVNVQEGIFRVFNEDVSTVDSDPAIVLKNLEVRGNSQAIDEENDANMYENSGGFIGFINKGSNVLLENTNFTFFTYGAQFDFDKDVRRSVLSVKDTTISDTWGPNIVAWRGYKLNITNSLLTRAGGPAFQCINDFVAGDAATAAAGIDRYLTVNMDSSSVIDNYITASAGWFNAHNISGISAYVSLIEGLISTELPDYKQDNKYTILKNNKYNFITLVQKTNESDSYATNKPHAVLNFANQQGTVNPYRYEGTTSLDAGGMVYALGQDIDTTLYLDMNNQQGKIAQYVQYLMGAGLSQSVAMTKAPQMALAYYVQSYLDSLDTDVKYLEIAASVPVVGYIGAVLEVSLSEVNV